MAKEEEKLSAAQRSKIRRLSAPREMSVDEEGGELNIVPFLDIIMNVLMFVLATVAVTYTATLDTSLAKAGGSGAKPPSKPTLNFTIFISGDGFGLKAQGGNVAPGCNGTGSGLAVSKRNGDYDYDSLKQCATKLKNASPDFDSETAVTITASPNVIYQVIISTMDAVRAGPKNEELFPDVNFGVAR